jgi:hypothetical protein
MKIVHLIENVIDQNVSILVHQIHVEEMHSVMPKIINQFADVQLVIMEIQKLHVIQ